MNKNRTFCVNFECVSRVRCDRYFYNYKFKEDDMISVSCFGNYDEECELFNEIKE